MISRDRECKTLTDKSKSYERAKFMDFDRLKDGQTDRQTYTQTARQADRQTDRKTNRHADRQ